jgi:endonuclease/exonuclease/phosphatase family metal-dependent hydrolase
MLRVACAGKMKEFESASFLSTPSPSVWPNAVRVISWNINRGLRLDGIIDFLRTSSAELILLQEADVAARRTGHRDIPREIAQALRMDYIFGREFVELAQGSRTHPAYHGQTTLSRLPLTNARILRFRDQSTFWRPRWFLPPLECLQRRSGGRMALISEIAVGGRTLVLYNVHLESRGGDELRMRQLSEILTDIRQHPPELPVLLTGDFNCDLTCGPGVPLVGGAGMNNPFALLAGRRTVLKNRHGKPAAIDCMLTRGTLAGRNSEIHESIAASDHFPLSLELHLH